MDKNLREIHKDAIEAYRRSYWVSMIDNQEIIRSYVSAVNEAIKNSECTITDNEKESVDDVRFVISITNPKIVKEIISVPNDYCFVYGKRSESRAVLCVYRFEKNEKLKIFSNFEYIKMLVLELNLKIIDTNKEKFVQKVKQFDELLKLSGK